MGRHARRAAVALGEDNFSSLDHLTLEYPACRRAAYRKGGHTRLHEGKPSGKRQIIPDNGRGRRPIATSDSGKGDIQGVTLTHGDRGSLCGQERLRGETQQGEAEG